MNCQLLLQQPLLQPRPLQRLQQQLGTLVLQISLEMVFVMMRVTHQKRIMMKVIAVVQIGTHQFVQSVSVNSLQPQLQLRPPQKQQPQPPKMLEDNVEIQVIVDQGILIFKAFL